MNPFMIAAGLAAGSSLLGAGAAIDSGKAQQVAYDFNSNVNKRNALVAESQADIIKRSAQLDIERLKNAFGELQAQQERALSFNGWDADSGTGLALQLETAAAVDNDIANLEYNSALAQAQSMEAAVQEKIQGDLNKLYGKQARRASEFAATGSLLSGATQAATLAGMA